MENKVKLVYQWMASDKAKVIKNDACKDILRCIQLNPMSETGLNAWHLFGFKI